MTPAEEASAKKLVREFLTKENLYFSRGFDAQVPYLYAMLDERSLAEQVQAARSGNRGAWNCCLNILDNHVSRHQPIPRELEALVLDTMRGKVNPPGDRKRAKHSERRLLASAVHMLQEQMGIYPTRNAEAKAKHRHSGCDIVAEVVTADFRDRGGELDGQATYDSVRKAYLERLKRLKTKAP